MKKYLVRFVICFSTCLMSFPLQAQEIRPDIIFDYYRDGNRALGKLPQYEQTFTLYFYWGRWLGENKSFLTETEIPKEEQTIRDEALNSSYKGVLSKRNYNDGQSRTSLKAIYILPTNQDKVVGYCLMEIMSIKAPLVQSDPSVIQIKSLPKSNYLQDKLQMPQNTSIIFYENDKGTFIERYGIITTPSYEILVLDAFYPKELEAKITPYVTKTMNEYVNMLYLTDLYYHDPINDNTHLLDKEIKKYVDKNF